MAITSWISRLLGATPAAALLAVSVAQGQSAAPPPPASVEEALHQMSNEAGVIFAGQVIAVHKPDGDNAASGFVEVEFRVDQAIRGCTEGTPYILREWAGLWTGTVRYRVGERRLMFLHKPGASGLSSPVEGMAGAVPIHGGSSQPDGESSNTPQAAVTDLRWVGAKLERSVKYRSEPGRSGSWRPVRPVRSSGAPIPFIVPQSSTRTVTSGLESTGISVVIASPAGASADRPIDPSAASVPAEEASVNTVLGMLKAWEKVQRAAQ